MGNTRTALRSLLWSWICLSACFSALCAHTIIAFCERARLFGGDYALHAHGSVPIAIVCVWCAGAGASILYLASILRAGRGSPPLLARSLRRCTGWRAIPTVSLAACAILAAMEFTEQAAAHHFDGTLSPYGGNPCVGLASIFIVTACLSLGVKQLLRWLEDAHDDLSRAVLAFIHVTARAAGPSERLTYFRTAFVPAGTCATARVFGRAPPRSCA